MTVNSGYGFPYPQSTEPVANGASNIQSLASAVDSKMGLFKIIPTGATGGSVTSDGDVLVNNAPNVNSVTVSGVFSSLFDSYKVIYTGGTASGLGDMRLRLGATTTGYAYNLIYTVYGSTSVLAVSSNNDANFKYIGSVATDSVSVNFEIYNPNRPYKTFISGSYVGVTTANGAGQFIGFLNNATAYTDFTLFLDSPATFGGGSIRIYGYRN